MKLLNVKRPFKNIKIINNFTWAKATINSNISYQKTDLLEIFVLNVN